MRLFKNIAGVAGVVAMLALTACGGSEIVPASTVGETASQAVTAADGGTVAVASGAAQIAIPAGALSADTTITLNTLGNAGAVDEDRLGSFIFEFGPDGTTFNTDVTITLKAGGSTPSGKEAKLAWLDGDKWKEVAGSKEVDGEVVGDVNHFTKFVIYYTDKEVIIENGDPICQDLSFQECGGDVVGEWSIGSYCFDTRRAANDNPYDDVPECANGNSTFVLDIEWLGSTTLVADGTYTTEMGTHVVIIATLNDKCLVGMSGGQACGGQMCDALATQVVDEGGVAEYKGGKCIITMDQGEDWDDPKTGTWVKEGNSLRMDGGEKLMPYCVEGDMMYIQQTSSDDTNDDGVDDITYTDTMVLKKM